MSLVRHYDIINVYAQLAAQQLKILPDVRLIVTAITVDVECCIRATAHPAVARSAERRDRRGNLIISYKLTIHYLFIYKDTADDGRGTHGNPLSEKRRKHLAPSHGLRILLDIFNLNVVFVDKLDLVLTFLAQLFRQHRKLLVTMNESVFGRYLPQFVAFTVKLAP